MALGMEANLSPGDFVLDDPQKRGRRRPPPQFLAHFYCGQNAAWIKMPLDTEVGLGPGDFVLDGGPAPLPEKGTESPQIFGPCLLWPNGWMDQDGSWHGGRPQPRRLYVRWGPSFALLKRGAGMVLFAGKTV